MPVTKNVPTSAYRLLLRNGITFHHVAAIVPYLAQLGIDGLSISSVFDTNDAGGGRRSFDPTRLDRRSGGEQGFTALDQALKDAEISLIIDVNPNQIPASYENSWWHSVLEWGSQAPYASHFDIDWKDRLTLPVLERPLAEELQSENLTLSFGTVVPGLGVSYSDDFFPLSPRSYEMTLNGIDNDLSRKFRDAASEATPYKSDAFHESLRKAYDDSKLSDRLELAAHFHQITRHSGQLQEILLNQPWVLTTPDDARRELTYRHSYDSLYSVGMQVQLPHVFENFHTAALELLQTSTVSGFRINQIDGVSDPGTYLQQLRRAAGKQTYLVTDKILLDREKHSDSWHVEGTAGYEFIAAASNLLVDHPQLPAMDEFYARSIGNDVPRAGHYRHAKSAILHKRFAPELHRLGNLLVGQASRDSDELEIRRAIGDTIVEMPVFRNYSAAGKNDYKPIFSAAGLDSSALSADVIKEFDVRFQQLSAAVMAQAIEESYRYDQGPIAFDEITLRTSDAIDPVQTFHKQMENKATSTPLGMSATSFSYATKFGEDARMRLLALSEAPQLWYEGVTDWRGRHAANVTTIEESQVPAPETEWLIYQTMAAIWPPTLHLDDQQALTAVQEDLTAFIMRAVREARKEAFWTDVNRPYELAIADYIDRLFLDRSFLVDFTDHMKPYWVAGALNSLSQTVLKMTTPGVPVVHIGSEVWDWSLSNSPTPGDLDVETLSARSAYADQSPLNNLLADWHSGAIKQRLTAKHLRLRQEHPALFLEGRYIPLKVTGPTAKHVVAFLRKHGSVYCLVAVPRLSFEAVSRFQEPFMPIPGWENTTIHLPAELSGAAFENVLTGATLIAGHELAMGEAMRDFSTVTLISR